MRSLKKHFREEKAEARKQRLRKILRWNKRKRLAKRKRVGGAIDWAKVWGPASNVSVGKFKFN